MHATLHMDSPYHQHMAMPTLHAGHGFSGKLGMVDNFSTHVDDSNYSSYMYGDDSMEIGHVAAGYPLAEETLLSQLEAELRRSREELEDAEIDVQCAQGELADQHNQFESAQTRLTQFVQSARVTTARLHEQDRISHAQSDVLQQQFSGCLLQNRALADEVAAMEREIAELEAEFGDEGSDSLSYDEDMGEVSAASAAAASEPYCA